MPKPADQTAFSRRLHDIHSGGVATIDEMAEAAGCTGRHMRHVVSMCSPKQLSLEKAIQLSAWLVDERDETRQLEGFLGLTGAVYLRPEPGTAETDDCLLEEMGQVQKRMSEADDALKSGDVDGARLQMQKAFKEMRRAMEDAQALHTTGQ